MSATTGMPCRCHNRVTWTSPFPISIALDFTTGGDPDLVFVGGSLRVRELVGGVGGSQGQEHARLGITCRRLK